VRWALAFALCLSAAPASAGDFWGQGGGQFTRQRAALVAEGDRYMLQAQSGMANAGGGATPLIVQTAARNAIAAYERALMVAEDVDVHYRAFFAAGFIDDRKGDICVACKDGFEATVRHAEAVFRLDPSTPEARDLAFQSCLALSKLGGLAGADADQYFERALQMYDRYRSLVDEVSDQNRSAHSRSISYSNAAELLMALGRLDESIDYYRRAIEAYALEPLHYYGLAVAYDRDGQWKKAMSAMKTAIELSGSEGVGRLRKEDVFFVPQGDLFYYLGLAQELLKNRDSAIDQYNRFLVRSPGNRYLDRAREHLQELDPGGARK
jgi:tetratricopeptide (TPR) repeat protein